jgi:hypothetical protein
MTDIEKAEAKIIKIVRVMISLGIGRLNTFISSRP